MRFSASIFGLAGAICNKKAVEVLNRCEALANQYPVSALGDLVLNVAQVKQGIVEDAGWEIWNPAYQSLVQGYIVKRTTGKVRAIQKLRDKGFGNVEASVETGLKATEYYLRELSRRMETKVKYRYS